jgi:myo-inositol-1-phosphate synthase
METNGNSSGGGRQQDKVRVAIIGVGNCANSFMQGLTYYKDANADDFSGLMHVDLGGYPARSKSWRVRRRQEGRRRSRRRDLGAPNDTISSRTSRRPSHGQPRDDARRDRQVPLEIVEGAGRTDDIVGTGPPGQRRLLPRSAPDAVSYPSNHNGRLRDGELHAGVHRARTLEQALQEAGVPVISDDIKSQVSATSRTACHVAIPRAQRASRQTCR